MIEYTTRNSLIPYRLWTNVISPTGLYFELNLSKRWNVPLSYIIMLKINIFSLYRIISKIKTQYNIRYIHRDPPTAYNIRYIHRDPPTASLSGRKLSTMEICKVEQICLYRCRTKPFRVILKPHPLFSELTACTSNMSTLRSYAFNLSWENTCKNHGNRAIVPQSKLHIVAVLS